MLAEKPTQTLSTEIIKGDAVFTLLADEWDPLVEKSMTHTPFQYLSYQKAWWDHLQPENSELNTVVVRDNGVLIGIACLYVVGDLVHFNGCVEETDYLDVITAEENAERVWTAVFNTLCSPEYPDWELLELCYIPAESPSRSIIPKLADQQSYTFVETVNEVCPIIDLPATFDEYLAQIDGKQRREIKRKLRRANGAGAELVIIGPEDDIDEAVDEFLTLLRKSTFEKRDWLTDGRCAMFHDAAKAAMEAGILQLLFMEVNGRKAATLFNFDYDGRIWVYNSGLDPEAFGNLSLGVVLTAKAIELAIENGRKDFDFLRGDEIYKYRFGAKDTYIYRLNVTRCDQ
ncbi:MAG TPA: GNAT family N-acetyltransferase [Anaerolineae bacterium]|nr:GNAT family N-acetyltransferase [Anaerolineae bacterium]